jgi:hypothetical protein
VYVAVVRLSYEKLLGVLMEMRVDIIIIYSSSSSTFVPLLY